MPLSQTPKPLQQLAPSPVHLQQVAPSSVLDPSQKPESSQEEQKTITSSFKEQVNHQDPQVPLFEGSSVMVNKNRLDDTKGSTPALYATKLFKLVFTWDEAKASSTSGKGTDQKTKEKLLKLDEKKLEAMQIHIKNKFETVEWKLVLASVDTL